MNCVGRADNANYENEKEGGVACQQPNTSVVETATSMFDRGDVIYTYTRKRALADGMQEDARQGIWADVTANHFRTLPVYMTHSLRTIIEEAVQVGHGKDHKGIWHDILTVAGWKMRASQQNTDMIDFTVNIDGRDHEIWVVIGPNDFDDERPALTFMLPEDY
mgnify:CR=1 FL=1